MVEEGKPAPDFSLTSDTGETISLASLRGKPVVLYFYPKDDTPGCTVQACSLRDSWGEFDRRGVAGGAVAHLLALAQTLLIAQAGAGLLLLSDDRRAPDRLHYAYGAFALGAVLSPWFYAPPAGPKRLLWFSGACLLAGALAARAYMTGS